MITTILVAHTWITTVSFSAMVVIGPVAGYWLVDRPHLASWLGLASVVPIAALTLIPASRHLAVGCATGWSLPTLSVSGLIETTQAFATALGRSCSTNDWLSNTLGSALGAAIAASNL